MSNILSRQDYVIVCLAAETDSFLRSVIEAEAPNWMVCPYCGVDDWAHVEGCEVSAEVGEYLNA